MAYLTNGWVGYLTRSAQQIMDSLLNRLAGKVPEMTDHSPSNPYVRNLEQMAGMHEQLGYYVDNAARETFVTKARLYKSMIQKARERDYQVIGNLPYSVDVQLSLDIAPSSDLIIPLNTVISNADGSIKYRLVTAATILTGQLVSNIVSAVQSERMLGVNMGVSTGASDYEVVFTDKIVHNSIKAYWNAVAWNGKETLAYSSPLSTDYVQTVNEDGNVVIYFGNALPLGLIPISGQVLTVDYDVTLGKDGYVGLGELNTLVSTVSGLPLGSTLSVINIANASGGSDVEDIESIRRHIPTANKTLMRAVTNDDFKDLVEQAPGVQSAGVLFDGRRTTNIYIVPVGGGIASSTLINNTQTYINVRKAQTTNPVIKSAGVVSTIIQISVEAEPNYANADVEAAVMAALLDFMSYTKQKVGPRDAVVHISDLYQTIENTPGVRDSNITVFAFKPYARPLNGSTPPLVWSTTPLSASSISQRWVIQFTNSTTFKLIKGATLVGTYSTGATVSVPELQFIIPVGAYSNGNSYEFYTYPYNANKVQLIEPSVANSQSADISLTVTGGY